MTNQTLIDDNETAAVDHSEQNDYLTRREAAALCRVLLSTFGSLHHRSMGIRHRPTVTQPRSQGFRRRAAPRT